MVHPTYQVGYNPSYKWINPTYPTEKTRDITANRYAAGCERSREDGSSHPGEWALSHFGPKGSGHADLVKIFDGVGCVRPATGGGVPLMVPLEDFVLTRPTLVQEGQGHQEKNTGPVM